MEGVIFEIMCKVFKVNDATGLAFGASDCWDSLSHMDLVSALEDKFQVELDEDQMVSLLDYQSILRVLKSHGLKA
jgi:acyl carrier protein|tara:strand:- start:692 stop:916 length:225 start_codon:yes stop_codon:yes gene_type:complete